MDPSRWYERGMEHLAARAWEAAVDAFTRALTDDPQGIGAHVGLARAYEGQRLFSRAVDSWRHGLALAPDSPPLATGLAEALRSAGCIADAEDAFNHAIHCFALAGRIAPPTGTLLPRPDAELAAAHAGHGESLRLLARPRAAIAAHDLALAALATSGGRRSRPGEAVALTALQGKAESNNALERWSESIPLWRAALEIEPGSTFARTGLETARRQERSVPSRAPHPMPEADALDPATPADRHRAWGRALCADRRLAEGEAALRKSLSLQPDWAEALVDLATALEEDQKWQQALDAWEAVLSRAPGRIDAACSRAEVLRKAERWNEAIAAYHQALSLEPEYLYALAGLGEALRLAGQPAEAVPWLERAVTRRPTHVFALNGLAAALSELGRPSEARPLWERAVALEPTSEFAKLGLRACIKTEATGLEHPPVVAPPRSVAGDPRHTRALVHLQMARSLLQQGRFSEVVAAADRAIAEHPTWGAPWILLGVARTEERQYRAAVSAFEEALRRDPTSVEAAVHRAEALRKNDDHVAAIESCDAILASHPHQPHALLCRAEALRMLARFPEAIAGFEEVLAHDPESWAGRCGKAAALNALGRFAEALPLWEAAWTANPATFVERGLQTCRAGLEPDTDASLPTRPRRTILRRGRGDDDGRAEPPEIETPRGDQPRPPENLEAQHHPTRRPDRQRARDDLDRGRSFYKERTYATAIGWFERALQADPTYAEAALRLGMALEDDRQYRRAIEAYQRCLAIDPKQNQAACNIGEAFRKHEKYDEAIIAYDHTLSLHADYLYALAGRAECMRMLADYGGSLQWFDRALAVGPRHAFAIQGKAAALNSLGRWSEALPLWSAALEIDPQSPFAREGKAQAEAHATPRPNEKPPESATPLLDEQGRDLTALARAGKLSLVVGRETEVRAVLKTLVRRLKANPLLLGEPGVGKTAIVEAVARRIASDDAPARLKGKRLIELSIGSLVAGTKYRGTLEERLKEIVKEARDNPGIIIFIDEIHTLVGAGRTEGGALDAANMLKPALARGEITVIGATTQAEYRKHFENDSALERRFQPIEVVEPTADASVRLLQALAERYEAHHGVSVAPEALRACVDLAVRFVPERRLPDKALDLLDEACSEASLSARSLVTDRLVAEVISEKTGIPVADLTAAQRERMAGLEATLRGQVVGQDEAIAELAGAVRLARSGLRDRARPRGVFLFAGSSGVGKTELARALTDFLFPEGNALVKLDMSEYAEKFTGSRLIGAPPGYAGHGEEGQLTGPLRKKPYTVVLLDEFEKAHPDVQSMFLSLFDEGRITDSEGRRIQAKDAFFIVTTNAGSEDIRKSRLGFSADSVEARHAEAMDRVRRAFRPELVNRIDSIVVFNDLSPTVLRQVVELHLEKLRIRATELRVDLSWEPAVVDACIAGRIDPTLGARPALRAIDERVGTPLGRWLLENDDPSCSWREVNIVVRSGEIALEAGTGRPAQVRGEGTASTLS